MNEELANALAAQPSNSPDYQAELDKHTATIKEQQERLKRKLYVMQNSNKKSKRRTQWRVSLKFLARTLRKNSRIGIGKKVIQINILESLMNSKETPLKDHQ